MTKVHIIGLMFCLCGTCVVGQDFYYATRNYTAVDGLPQSQVKAIAEDKNGYLWIGTQGGGLARFDGRTFKVYTTMDGLLTNQVIGLVFDRHENLWIAHPRGLTRFNGLEFQRFQSPTVGDAKPIRRMYVSNDTIFTVNGSGLVSKIYNDSLYYWNQALFGERLVRGIHVGTESQTLFYLDDNSFVVRTSSGPAYPLDISSVTGTIRNAFNHKNEVMLQSENGVFRVDFSDRKVVKVNWDLPHRVLVYNQKEDEFWSADEGFLYKEKRKDGELKRTTILKDVFVNQVLHDSEGNVWLATDGRGLYKYYIQDFIQCSSENMRGIMAITMDSEGATWIGTMGKGLWRIKKGKINSYLDKSNDSYRNSIACVAEAPDGTIWAGSAYGLGRYNAVRDEFEWFTKEDGLSGDGIMCLAFDDKGMWVGTGNGLNYYDGKTFKVYKSEDGLSGNVIRALYYFDKYKTLYVGTEYSVNTVKGKSIGTLALPEMVNTWVLSINPYRDSLLLVGTSGTGVVVLNPNTGSRKLITTRDGMPSDFVYFVAADENDYVWMGTEKGINHIKLGDRLEVVENLHFDFDNGLKGVETNQNAFYLSPDSKYFGLVDGVYEFNDVNEDLLRSFDVHLTDVQILYGEYSPRPYADSSFGFYKIPYRPVLPPDKNHLTFEFNRVDKHYPKSVKYRYLLENFDKTWSQPSSTNEVTYSNLPPGEYTFRVMSTNNRGSWSDTEIAYGFSIKPPFYKTTAFIVGMLIFCSGVVTLILYVRVKQRVNRIVMLERIRQKEQESLRKEIARDFHDEMGNQLTRIINYVSLLKLNGNGNGNGNGHDSGLDLYTKVENSAKYLYTGTRDFIWSIDPVNDELSKLFIHIRDFGEKLFEEKQINFRAYNKAKEGIKLPYGFSREANLIFKEAMTNSFKSSGATNVTLLLDQSGSHQFELSLEDDGIGFSTADVEKSNGLQNIRERANRINAVLRIHSVKNEGTRIVLCFTLTKSKKYGLAF
jgi:ligand-binding sensor domain-containing protein/signal transduction histidine kinase